MVVLQKMTMETTLAEVLTGSDKRTQTVSDCVALVDSEVAAKSGMSGLVIKGAYKAVKAIKPGFVSNVVDSLLDRWLDRLEPHFQAWGKDGTFADYVSKHDDKVSEDLLAVTDDRARESDNKTAKKFYQKLRPSAKTNVVMAVPKLGALVDRRLAE